MGSKWLLVHYTKADPAKNGGDFMTKVFDDLDYAVASADYVKRKRKEDCVVVDSGYMVVYDTAKSAADNSGEHSSNGLPTLSPDYKVVGLRVEATPMEPPPVRRTPSIFDKDMMAREVAALSGSTLSRLFNTTDYGEVDRSLEAWVQWVYGRHPSTRWANWWDCWCHYQTGYWIGQLVRLKGSVKPRRKEQLGVVLGYAEGGQLPGLLVQVAPNPPEDPDGMIEVSVDDVASRLNTERVCGTCGAEYDDPRARACRLCRPVRDVIDRNAWIGFKYPPADCEG